MTEEQWVPGNKKELMSAIEREWKLLMNLAEGLTDEQMTRPDSGGWSPKDNLAHLSEWMNVLIGHHLDQRPPHEVLQVSEEVAQDWEMDAFNLVLFDRNKNRPRREVMSELKQVYGRLVAKLEPMSFEDLLKPRRADDPQKRPILMWILGDTVEHFQEHRETIEKSLKEN